MTYRQAVNLLDAVKAGASVPESVITRALEATGDLLPDEAVVLDEVTA